MLKKYVVFSKILSLAVIGGALLLSRLGSAVAVWTMQTQPYPTVIIDAGHGGEDGGAISITGIRESGLNLEISKRVRDFLNFMGLSTKMIRDSDVSVYTEGETIAQKKVSDIHHRAKIVEATPNALLISIHQNHFSEAKYRGAQIFYAETQGSAELAERLQGAIAQQADPKNRRQCKKAQDVYLMKHISCTAVLIECGFLSNYEEEQLLQTAAYQKKLAAVIGCCIYNYLEASNEV